MAALRRASVPLASSSSLLRPRPRRRDVARARVPRSSSAKTVRVTRAGGLDEMMVTFVNVACKEGTEEDFALASLSNASNSVEEEDNCRFDCLQDLEDPTKFLLVEIYKTAAGPTAHKATPHYNAWRETVGDMMAAPRAAAKYVPVYPWAGLWGTGAAARRGKGRGQGEKQAGAGGVAGAVGDVEGGRDDDAPEEKGEALAGHFLSLASEGASKDGGGDDASVNAVDSAGGGGGSAAGEDKDTKVITHVHVTVKPGKEDEFIECTIANAASSVLEPDNLRFDVLRNAARPAEFLLVEVYATAEGPAAHKNTPHYRCWRDDVEELMAAPREAKRYAARFPVEPSAWKMILSEE